MNTYRLVPDGSDYRLLADTPERELARITRVFNRNGDPSGWRVKPCVVLNGPHSRTWPTIADVLAGLKLMTLAKGRRLVADAGGATSAVNPPAA